MRSPHFQRLISAIIVAGVLSAVVGTATAHEDHSTDEWPTTCVDLNDIVEEHLGNPHIVGIYQNTFGDQAEAACQTDHRNDVIAVFGWAIATESGASGSDLELDWPTTCVQLNDIVEGHLGNQGNVAIYRNTFGDQAEVACQNDHRDDVRSVFAWAIGGGAPLVTGVLPFPAATPTPTPIPGRSYLYRPVMPPEHMVYVWWEWISDEGEFESLDIDFTIHNDIVGFSEPHGLYLMLGSAQISGAPFYFGLQTDVYDPASGYRGKSLIFSRSGTRYLDHARFADPVEGWTQSSGHEGDFIGVRRSYQWGAGVYRVRIAPDGSDAIGRWFGMWITDRSTGETVWGGSLRFPYENGKAAIRSPLYTTMEIYGGAPIRPIDIPEWHVSIARPSGDSVKPTRGVTGFQAFSSHILNSDARYDPTAEVLHLRVGGLTQRSTLPQEILFD